VAVRVVPGIALAFSAFIESIEYEMQYDSSIASYYVYTPAPIPYPNRLELEGGLARDAAGTG
jgi:hypothetical protein